MGAAQSSGRQALGSHGGRRRVGCSLSCSPRGRMSAARKPLRSEDFPLDCVPTTTRRGNSGSRSRGALLPPELSVTVLKMPERVLATLSTCSVQRARAVCDCTASAAIAAGALLSRAVSLSPLRSQVLVARRRRALRAE
eukprot:scaffold273690_cov32-Tisochrysis_lutea.AAC.2